MCKNPGVMKCACNHNSGNVGRWASLGWVALRTDHRAGCEAIQDPGPLFCFASSCVRLTVPEEEHQKLTSSLHVYTPTPTHAPTHQTAANTEILAITWSKLRAGNWDSESCVSPLRFKQKCVRTFSSTWKLSHQRQGKKKKEMNLRSRDMKWGEKDPVLSPALCSCNTTAQWTLCGGKWVHQVGIRSSGKNSMAQCCPFSYPFMAFHFLPGDDVIRRAHKITGTCPVAFPPWELSTAFCGSSSRGLRQSKDRVW